MRRGEDRDAGRRGERRRSRSRSRDKSRSRDVRAPQRKRSRSRSQGRREVRGRGGDREDGRRDERDDGRRNGGRDDGRRDGGRDDDRRDGRYDGRGDRPPMNGGRDFGRGGGGGYTSTEFGRPNNDFRRPNNDFRGAPNGFPMQMQMHPMHPMMQMQMMQMMQNQARMGNMGNMGNMGMGGPMVKGLGKNRMLPGDWVCTACRFHNFANKTQCRTCQLPKSSSVPVSSMQENMGNPRAPATQSPRGGTRSVADTREVGHDDAPAPFSLDTAEVLSRVLSDPNREIIDVSWPITETATSWQDKSPVAFDAVQEWDTDSCRSSTVNNLTYHTGTHITAPAHIDKDGAPIEHEDWGMCGECVVLDLTEVRRKHGIAADDLKPFEAQLKPGIIVLLKTSNSSSDANAEFREDFVGLAQSGAAYLVGQRVKGVGCDYLSIERKDVEPVSTYKTLLGGGVAVIEGLRLADVQTVDLEEEAIGAREGNYTLACLFLRLNGVEAAPARAVLLPSGR